VHNNSSVGVKVGFTMNAVCMAIGNDAVTERRRYRAWSFRRLYDSYRRKLFNATALITHRAFKFGVAFCFCRSCGRDYVSALIDKLSCQFRIHEF